jgi:hypothetical protein
MKMASLVLRLFHAADFALIFAALFQLHHGERTSTWTGVSGVIIVLVTAGLPIGTSLRCTLVALLILYQTVQQQNLR